MMVSEKWAWLHFYSNVRTWVASEARGAIFANNIGGRDNSANEESTYRTGATVSPRHYACSRES
jgi:hypothetical protein